jgi:hypothetical protein
MYNVHYYCLLADRRYLLGFFFFQFIFKNIFLFIYFTLLGTAPLTTGAHDAI